jgi:tRNA nucleotidyltransferase (CCA-adding enzyme)
MKLSFTPPCPHRSLFLDLFGDRVFLVGGTVRDALLYGQDRSSTDLDLVVTGLGYEDLAAKLSRYGSTSTVGKSFAVVKFTLEGITYDLAVPRKERLKDPGAAGHRNFDIESGEHVTLEEDLSRRDFTCNAMACRLSDGELVDPFNGRSDVESRIIRMTSPQSFFDDPLRILRAARFASVHGFTIDEVIFPQARLTNLAELSHERVAEEICRLLLESKRPSRGLKAYLGLGVLEAWFPELYKLTLTIQDAQFHPETDDEGHHTVWGHILIALDLAAKVVREQKLPEPQALTLVLATLLHDLGKAETTRWEYKRGRLCIASLGHDVLGAGMAVDLLSGLRIETRGGFEVKEMVGLLIRNHHRLYEIYRNREHSNFKTFARLLTEMRGHDRLLLWLDWADRCSREPDALNLDWRKDDLVLWYEAQAAAYNLSLETVAPILRGRDLIALGMKPGPAMGNLLERLYEAQLDGLFRDLDGGVALARNWLNEPAKGLPGPHA